MAAPLPGPHSTLAMSLYSPPCPPLNINIVTMLPPCHQVNISNSTLATHSDQQQVALQKATNSESQASYTESKWGDTIRNRTPNLVTPPPIPSQPLTPLPPHTFTFCHTISHSCRTSSHLHCTSSHSLTPSHTLSHPLTSPQ